MPAGAQRELRRRALAAGSAASSLKHCRCIRALTAATVGADLGCRSKAKACDHDDECRPFCALPRDRAERLDNVRIPASQIDDHWHPHELTGVIKDDHSD